MSRGENGHQLQRGVQVQEAAGAGGLEWLEFSRLSLSQPWADSGLCTRFYPPLTGALARPARAGDPQDSSLQIAHSPSTTPWTAKQQSIYRDQRWPQPGDVSQHALFYTHSLDRDVHYAALVQQQASAPPEPMAPGPSSPSPASLAGVLTCAQRARAQQLESAPPPPPPLTMPEPLQMPRRSPSASMYAPQFQPMPIFDAGAYIDHAVAPSPRTALTMHYHQGSPPYPSTPTTISSTPSSEPAYHSTAGRSSSPALSLASTFLTSRSTCLSTLTIASSARTAPLTD